MNSLRNLTDVDLDQLDRSDADLAIPAADAAAAAPPDHPDMRIRRSYRRCSGAYFHWRDAAHIEVLAKPVLFRCQ